MNTKQAKELGQQIASQVNAGKIDGAYSILAPALTDKTPFSKLDLIGELIGDGPLKQVNAFLRRISVEKTMGGWVVIGKCLGQQLDRDLPGGLERCRAYIIAADVWYGTDILGERVPGPALVSNFDPSIKFLAPWRVDENVWIRRAVGVAVHYWTKRSKGAQELTPQAKKILDFLEPMFSENETSAIKGVGWGLKTLGKHYPDIVTSWLVEEILPSGHEYRKLMLRKAITYLSSSQKKLILSTST